MNIISLKNKKGKILIASFLLSIFVVETSFGANAFTNKFSKENLLKINDSFCSNPKRAAAATAAVTTLAMAYPAFKLAKKIKNRFLGLSTVETSLDDVVEVESVSEGLEESVEQADSGAEESEISSDESLDDQSDRRRATVEQITASVGRVAVRLKEKLTSSISDFKALSKQQKIKKVTEFTASVATVMSFYALLTQNYPLLTISKSALLSSYPILIADAFYSGVKKHTERWDTLAGQIEEQNYAQQVTRASADWTAMFRGFRRDGPLRCLLRGNPFGKKGIVRFLLGSNPLDPGLYDEGPARDGAVDRANAAREAIGAERAAAAKSREIERRQSVVRSIPGLRAKLRRCSEAFENISESKRRRDSELEAFGIPVRPDEEPVDVSIEDGAEEDYDLAVRLSRKERDARTQLRRISAAEKLDIRKIEQARSKAEAEDEKKEIQRRDEFFIRRDLQEEISKQRIKLREDIDKLSTLVAPDKEPECLTLDVDQVGSIDELSRISFVLNRETRRVKTSLKTERKKEKDTRKIDRYKTNIGLLKTRLSDQLSELNRYARFNHRVEVDIVTLERKGTVKALTRIQDPGCLLIDEEVLELQDLLTLNNDLEREIRELTKSLKMAKKEYKNLVDRLAKIRLDIGEAKYGQKTEDRTSRFGLLGRTCANVTKGLRQRSRKED